MDVPLATFGWWRCEARRATRERVAFARVEVVPTEAAPVPTSQPAVGMRLVVRGVAGHEATLDRVDAATAVRLVALVLGRQ